MNNSAQQVLQQAIRLSALDRAIIVEGLIASLDKPDYALDALWLREAIVRMNAYHAGEIATIDANEVFAELGLNT